MLLADWMLLTLGDRCGGGACVRLPPSHHAGGSCSQHRSLRSSTASLPLPAPQLDIAYDSFIRTTDPRHEALVATMLERVWERGDIYKAQYR